MTDREKKKRWFDAVDLTPRLRQILGRYHIRKPNVSWVTCVVVHRKQADELRVDLQVERWESFDSSSCWVCCGCCGCRASSATSVNGKKWVRPFVLHHVAFDFVSSCVCDVNPFTIIPIMAIIKNSSSSMACARTLTDRWTQNWTTMTMITNNRFWHQHHYFTLCLKNVPPNSWR